MKSVILDYRDKKHISEDCKEFWYEDLKEWLIDNDFIIIEGIYVPKELRNRGIGTGLLDHFSSSFGEDIIILLSSGLLCKEFPKEPSEEEFNPVLSKLDKFFTERNYLNINEFSKTYEYKELYVYDNKAGKEFYNRVKDYYKMEV